MKLRRGPNGVVEDPRAIFNKAVRKFVKPFGFIRAERG